MSNTEISIWKPIKFDNKWTECSTAILDNLLPSWKYKREQFKRDIKEYDRFINRLKRQHAIETGIIEKLYDLKEGITETFIKEGFIESYLQHGDTNISSSNLMKYLHSHFEAIDFVFDLVKLNRTISKSFILELHQLITQHQETSEAIDSLGNIVQVNLIKGQFKKHENNPRRSDGTIFLYCPPIHVETEIEKLLEIYEMLEEKNVHTVIKAAWFHHAFVQIHPFQDGNGRIARLLASLILIKGGLFPFTVNRNDKKKYIESLEKADGGNYQAIVDYFCDVQKRNIEFALNLKTEIVEGSFNQVVEHLSGKIKVLNDKVIKEREDHISRNREKIFNFCSSVVGEMVNVLKQNLEKGADVSLEVSNKSNVHYFTHQIAQYATQNNYFFNSSLYRGWFRIKLDLPNDKKYQIILSLHHYGYDDSTLAIGAFLEIVTDTEKNQDKKIANRSIRKSDTGSFYTTIPLEIKPLTISVEREIVDLENSIKGFLQDSVTIGLAFIASEIH